MGEFTTGSGDTHNPDNVTMGGEQEGVDGYNTDVPDVKSDDIIKQGKDEFPCFDVDSNEFYQNMQAGRKRLRFKTDSSVQKYMQNTKYQRPFFVRHTDENGKKYVRKIK